MNILIKNDNRAVFCNSKWAEANGLASDAWGCYMELGKELRMLKDGELKGQFKEWCGQELEFSYDWARILMNAYSRYELSEFKDAPQSNIRLYASEDDSSRLLNEPTQQNDETMTKPRKETKQDTPQVMSKIDVWCEEQGLDDLQTEVAKAWYTLSKKLVKKYGVQGVEEAIQLINDSPRIYNQV